jgi:hypothetical protein
MFILSILVDMRGQPGIPVILTHSLLAEHIVLVYFGKIATVLGFPFIRWVLFLVRPLASRTLVLLSSKESKKGTVWPCCCCYNSL